MVKFNFNDSNAFGGIGKPGGRSAPAVAVKFSLADAKAFVFKHKVETACAGGILLTLLLLWQFFLVQSGKIRSIDSDIQLLLDKEQPALDLDRAMNQGALLLEGLPSSLAENRFISQLTALANKRKVTVTAVSPPATYDNGFFRRTSVKLSCTVRSFKDALLFVNDIEHSPHALKVDSWKAQQSGSIDQNNAWGSTDGSTKNLSTKDAVKLEMVFVVSSIELIDNEKKNQ